MTAEDTNWNSRLCVMFKQADGAATIVSPISNFNPTDDMPVEIIDSIDGCNLGYSFGNPRYTFDFEVQAVNKNVFRQIYKVAKKRTRFSMGIATLNLQSDDWVFDSIEFFDCIVTNVSQSSDNTNKVPTMKFQAVCLDTSTSNDGLVITTDHVGGANGTL